jgi:hypothetical protein
MSPIELSQDLLKLRNSKHQYAKQRGKSTKTTYTIMRESLMPPARDIELALFTCMLQSPIARKGIESLGVGFPEKFNLIHNTGIDDPPDLLAMGLGFECTEFPPNQTVIQAVYRQRGGRGMTIPGFSQTGGDIKQIRAHVHQPGYDAFYDASEDIAALERAFLKILTGTKSKDIHGNDVLLLDQRQDNWPDAAAEAIRRALQQTQPKHIRLIFLVRWKHPEIGNDHPIPQVVQMYPSVP